MKSKEKELECTAIHMDVVNRVSENVRGEKEIGPVTDFFKILGDRTRMRILCALSVEEMCVCDLSALLMMTKSAISHQLKTLKDGNQVKYRREGKNIYYSLEDEHIKSILEQAFIHMGHKSIKNN